MLRLYWWDKRENIGDFFGHWLLEKLGFNNCHWEGLPDIATAGSILDHNSKLSANTKIWGSGFHKTGKSSDFNTVVNQANIYAVRGKLTAEKLPLTHDVALGDPGLLLSKFYSPAKTKKYKFGIVCHHLDEQYFLQNYADSYKIILTSTTDVEKFADSLAECEFIFSTSLHGIIFSHSLGIPAVHLERVNVGSLDNFKFKDYYSVLDINYTKIAFKDFDSKTIDSIIQNSTAYLPSSEKIIEIQNSLLEAFPYKLPKVALCAIAKNENNYIREWIEYHLKLGINKIILYDNNDVDGETFDSVIGDYISLGNVQIIDVRGEHNAQIKSFENCYQDFGKDFDWICFWDIDEFLFLDEDTSIQNFIISSRFKDYNCININWQYFDDNNLIEVTDNNYNVLTRFINPSKRPKIENKFCKRIVKTQVEGVHINSSHGPINRNSANESYYKDVLFNPTIIACNAAGILTTVNGCEINNPTHKYAKLHHYRFKTISEYVTNKMRRGYPTLYKNEGKDLGLTDFFRLNQVTLGKLKWLSDHNIPYNETELRKLQSTGRDFDITAQDKITQTTTNKKVNYSGSKPNTYLYF